MNMETNNNTNNIIPLNNAIFRNFVEHMYNGDYTEIKNLISIYPNILNFENVYTFGTPLYVYLNQAENPNKEMLEFLIDRGAKLNLETRFVGTALINYFKCKPECNGPSFSGHLSRLFRENIDIDIVNF